MINSLELINKLALRLNLNVTYVTGNDLTVSAPISKLGKTPNNKIDQIKELNELERTLQDIAREIHDDAFRLATSGNDDVGESPRCNCGGMFHDINCKLRIK
jgi:hypothetical protein